MALSFADLKKAALETDKLELTDAMRRRIADSGDSRYVTAATICQLASDFCTPDGIWNTTVHVVKAGQHDVFSTIFETPAEGPFYPEFIGLFDWANGALSIDDVNVPLRMDMAAAIVVGADPEKDMQALLKPLRGYIEREGTPPVTLFPVFLIV